MTERQRSLVTAESELLLDNVSILHELGFLAGHRSQGKSIGLLTSCDSRPASQTYPLFLGGMLVVEKQLETLDQTPPDIGERLIQYIITTRTQQGQPVTNEEIAQIREQIAEGQLSEQLAVLASGDEQQDMVDINMLPEEFSGQRTSLAEYTARYSKKPSKEDILENKRLALAYWQALTSDLETLYGEVDLPSALLAELLLDPPFLQTIVSSGPNLDEAAKRRHLAYFDEMLGFIKNLNPTGHFDTFQETTGTYQVDWIEEEPSPQVSDFDREYLKEVYHLAKKMLAGDFEIDEIHNLLGKTILRRGRFFNLVEKGHQQIAVVPAEPEPLTFADIGGYEEQRAFYQKLLGHLNSRNTIIADLRIILAAGKSGTGKSLGVTAFTNALPDHARALFLDHSTPVAEYLKALELARFHPELELFVVIEDIDTLAGKRDSSATGFFLEIDSAIPGATPHNLHLLATTNRPDVIDPAIIRPGRTPKILVYPDKPPLETRQAIIQIHARRQNLALSQEALKLIAEKTADLTPDEIQHIVWSLVFNDVAQPTEQDIDGFVAEIRQRHEAERASRDLFRSTTPEILPEIRALFS